MSLNTLHKEMIYGTRMIISPFGILIKYAVSYSYD